MEDGLRLSHNTSIFKRRKVDPRIENECNGANPRFGYSFEFVDGLAYPAMLVVEPVDENTICGI
eukprot:749147-Hanusia_phi.AAC.1